jgi:hypothetical protein
MSVSDVYLSLLAAESERAQPRTSCRHAHISGRPFVVLGYHLAGDRGAPVALMWGTDPTSEKTLVVPEPRNRGLRFSRLIEFATDLCAYLDDPENTDPQIVVPNAATANWLFDVVGRFTWNQPTDGDYAVHPVIPRAGKHLMYLGQEFDHPGGSTVLSAVSLLTQHYRSGQTSQEDLNLGALLGWVLPGAGETGRQAALRQEAGPPAGPVSAPQWDRDSLEPKVGQWNEARGDVGSQGRIERVLQAYAAAELGAGWEQVWTVIDLIGHQPAGNRVAGRRASDLRRLAEHGERMEGEARFSSRPGPRAAATRLRVVEAAQADYEAAMLLDDPYLLASKIVDGTAVAGEVIHVDATNRDRIVGTNGRLRAAVRPVVTLALAVDSFVSPRDPLRLSRDPRVLATVRSVTPSSPTSPARAELTVNAGAVSAPTMNRLPRLGELVIFSEVGPPEGYRQAELPDEVPWTHRLPEDSDPPEPASTGSEDLAPSNTPGGAKGPGRPDDERRSAS